MIVVMLEFIVTLVFASLVILFITYGIDKKTFDFWFGCTIITTLYFIVDTFAVISTIQYHIGVNDNLFFGMLAVFVGVKAFLTMREYCKEKTPEPIDDKR